MYEGAGLHTSILEAVLFYWNLPSFALENFDPRFIACTWHCGWKNSTHEFGEGRHTATAVAIQLSVVSLYNWSQAKRRQCWYMDPSVRLNKEQWDHFYGGDEKNVYLIVRNGFSLGTLGCVSMLPNAEVKLLHKNLSHPDVSRNPLFDFIVSEITGRFFSSWHCKIVSISF